MTMQWLGPPGRGAWIDVRDVLAGRGWKGGAEAEIMHRLSLLHAGLISYADAATAVVFAGGDYVA